MLCGDKRQTSHAVHPTALETQDPMYPELQKDGADPCLPRIAAYINLANVSIARWRSVTKCASARELRLVFSCLRWKPRFLLGWGNQRFADASYQRWRESGYCKP